MSVTFIPLALGEDMLGIPHDEHLDRHDLEEGYINEKPKDGEYTILEIAGRPDEA